MHVHVFVCMSAPRLLITSGMIEIPYNYCIWLNKFHNFYMVAVVGIVSKCDLRIEACCKNQPYKST